MKVLANSQRRFHKATYSQIQPDDSPEEQKQLKKIKRAWEKISYLRSLAIRGGEIPLIEALIKEEKDAEQQKLLRQALKQVEKLIEDDSPGYTIRQAPGFAEIDHDTLIKLGRLLVRVRRNLKKEITALLNKILSAYKEYLKKTGGKNGDSTDSDSNPENGTDENKVEGKEEFEDEETLIDEALAWAAEKKDPRIDKLDKYAKSLNLTPEVYSNLNRVFEIKQLANIVFNRADATSATVNGFEERMAIQPVGRLHLERIEMTPVGVERGELVYSVPLAPKETVNIAHKEWAIQTEEFEDIVKDQLAEFSEQGVTEKKELAQSTESQQKHSNELSLSSSYNHVGFSASVGLKSTSDDEQAKKESRNQSIELTRKASSRTRRDHKQSFKVSSVAGTEDKSVRVISNPSESEAMRIDYYQLMRKWRVDLYRYDLRMTYDVVIPNPGASLISRIEELRTLDGLIEAPFKFHLATTDINIRNFRSLAARFGATVEDPPKQTKVINGHKEYAEVTKEQFDAIDLEIEPDYEIVSGFIHARFDPDSDHLGDAYFDVLLDEKGPVWAKDFPDIEAKLIYHSDLNHLQGRTGRVSFLYVMQSLRAGTVYVEVNLRLTSSAYQRWRFNAWNAMRQAAEERYYQSRQILIERRDKLLEEMGKWDALTLRKMEREELMKGVLRWLFGPTFELVPEEIRELYKTRESNGAPDYATLNPKSLTDESWQKVMDFGEFIKFIHQAIEWENVLYFYYPYFWDSPKNWNLKRYLKHPNSLHSAFLRAGAARVVLTIRPGFEKDFTRLLETGAFGAIEKDHPYITIAQEIQNYAKTHYPGIPPANPEKTDNDEEVENTEHGELIGRWYEYTSTSALDISLNTVLAELA